VNLPNKITLSRLVLTGIFFALLAIDNPVTMNISLAVFIIAALTDLVDGWLARKYAMVTDFGRVADPFADKILVCGGLIFLLAKRVDASRVRDWMVVIIIAREFLVSGMRSLAESKGIPFGAIHWGKLKALSQNIAVGLSILYVANSLQDIAWMTLLVDVMLYITTVLTAISGVVYVRRARSVLTLGT